VYDRNSLRQVEPEMEGEVADEPALDNEPSDEAELAEEEADLADMPEPVFATGPVVTPAAVAPRPARPAAALSNLAADMALGRARIVLLAGVSEGRDAAIAADVLVAEALQKGLSVCRIDAGSGRPSSAPGLTDLCAEQASFGDVVHKVREGLAEVPWGTVPAMDRRSIKPITLVEALADIYEVVIISTGRVCLNSSLPIFAGLHGRLAMVRQNATPAVLVDAVSADAATLGFDSIESVMVPEPQSAVA
jgi:hypothetical protein